MTEPATLEQMAAMEFKPWEGEPDSDFNVETLQERAHYHFFTLALAHRLMYNDKEELAAKLKEMSDEQGETLFESFGAAKDFFKGTHELLSAAEARLLCAGASIVREAEE